MECCVVRVLHHTLCLFGRHLYILGPQGLLAYVVWDLMLIPLKSFLGREVLEEIRFSGMLL